MVDTSIISCHGNAARINGSTTYQLEHSPDSSQVRNMSSGKANYQVFFNLPSPESATKYMKSVNFDLTTQSVIITRVIIYLGGDEILNKGVKKSEGFSLPLGSSDASIEYAGTGISVTLEMEMPGTSKIDFRSVAIDCQGV